MEFYSQLKSPLARSKRGFFLAVRFVDKDVIAG